MGQDATRLDIHAQQETWVKMSAPHILRVLQKNYKSKVSGTFFEDKILLYIWRLLSGCIILNLYDDQILSEFVLNDDLLLIIKLFLRIKLYLEIDLIKNRILDKEYEFNLYRLITFYYILSKNYNQEKIEKNFRTIFF